MKKEEQYLLKLSKVIEYTRKKLGITQSELVSGICSRKTYSLMNNGTLCKRKYYELISEKLNLKIDYFDSTKVDRLIDKLYEQFCNYDNSKYEELFPLIFIELENVDCVGEEYRKAINFIYKVAVLSNFMDLDLMFHCLELMDMFTPSFSILIKKYSFDCMIRNYSNKKIEGYAQKYSLFNEAIILHLNKIAFLIAQNRFLDAYKAIIKVKDNTTNANYLLWCIRYEVLIYLNIQSDNMAEIIVEVTNFITENESEISINLLSDVYYQLGIMNLLKGKYTVAFNFIRKFKTIDETHLPALVFYNFLALQMRAYELYKFILINKKDKDPKMYAMYSYLNAKYLYLMRKSENYDNVLRAYKKMICLNIVDNPLLQVLKEEAKWIRKLQNNKI